MPSDVTDPGSIQAAVERFGRIDVLVNNAGTGLLAAEEDSNEATVRAPCCRYCGACVPGTSAPSWASPPRRASSASM
ncbi:hypothetical protein [Nonomuraea sp. NPDC049625]|uniref:hypothetical protein n=1 Tax=Nonomuraea sp. NPDC049625 TaxID=3155775 RepID=UPI003416BDC4